MAKAINLFEGNSRGSQLMLSKSAAFYLLNSATEFVDHESVFWFGAENGSNTTSGERLATICGLVNP
ncbi:MAG: hypothetical protein ACJAW8_001630 [Oleispira sp.]|jgi:hypothetical protein